MKVDYEHLEQAFPFLFALGTVPFLLIVVVLNLNFSTNAINLTNDLISRTMMSGNLFVSNIAIVWFWFRINYLKWISIISDRL